MTVYELPSLVALLFKLGLLAYATKSTVRTADTKLFLILLALLSLFNLVEFTGLSYIAGQGFDVTAAEWFGRGYFALFVPCVALLLHISLLLSTDLADHHKSSKILLALYLPLLPLEYLLLFTDQIVAGFEHFRYTVLRVPGPFYFLFEAYAIAYLTAACGYLVYGARPSRAPWKRLRNRLWLLALAPMVLLVTYLIVANHFGWTKLTSTFYVPIAITFFLIVTTYATHQFRLFDIEFYIPLSTIRKRKTVFYARIRSMIAEIADLDSVDTGVKRLADTLRCPVALVGANRPALAAAGAANFRTDVPEEALRSIDHIVVRNEIAETMPEMHDLMKRHGVAAVVPFHPRSEYASGWLLLGDAFSEQVYTRLDFKVVEELFDKMADLFLDKLVAMRGQLAEAMRRVRLLEARSEEMQGQMLLLKRENTELRALAGQLRREQAADSLLARPELALRVSTRARLTLIGRDKGALKTLRATFPQVAHYTSVTSAGFRRQPQPDVLICRVDDGEATEAHALARFLAEAEVKLATILYGSGAHRFAADNKRQLLGRIVEILPDDANEAQVARRIEAIVALASALHAVPQPDQPLLGRSPVFGEQMQQVQRLAGLVDPLLIKTTDFDTACALAQYIHERSASKGAFRVLREAEVTPEVTGDAANETALIASIMDSVREGTLMVVDAGALTDTFAHRLFEAIDQAGDVRVIAGCSALMDCAPDALLAPLRPFLLEMPTLRERRQDLPLLAHYFTLQFNLQSGQQRYLTQSELDELMADDYPPTMLALKHRLFERLGRGEAAAGEARPASLPQAANDDGADKTLDEHVSLFEAQIIADTLKRCGGNKSKAARVLGLRPNTLHYKLERHGIAKGQKS